MAVGHEKKAVYFGSLTVEGVKCFKGKETLDLTGEDGKPSMMNVILGNNGAGKTTLLTCLLGMMPVGIPEKHDGGTDQVEGASTFQLIPRRIVGQPFPKFEGDISCKFRFEGYSQSDLEWTARSNGYNLGIFELKNQQSLLDFTILAFGANRTIDQGKLAGTPLYPFEDFLAGAMFDAQDHLLRFDFGSVKDNVEAKKLFGYCFNAIKSLLPNIIKISGKYDQVKGPILEVETIDGKVDFDELSLGNQIVLTMAVDIVVRLVGFGLTPDESPFVRAAVILIDEIDLHLHPTWQQRILSDLSSLFPNVQFIVTTHSPLVLQSVEKVNLFMLQPKADGVKVHRHERHNFQGWSVEEILMGPMDLPEARSEDFLLESRNFEEAISRNDFETAKRVSKVLSKMLPENSVKHKLMEIRMSALTRPQKV
jgi:energy-coupling factor transporter ATP-binding protein EcfA2